MRTLAIFSLLLKLAVPLFLFSRHSSIFLTEEERTGQAASEEEEIESFTNENFEEDVHGNKEGEEEAKKKDEL